MNENDNCHLWYGWIPTLTKVRDTILTTSDLQNGDSIKYAPDDEKRPTELIATFESDQGPASVGVHIENGFIIINLYTDQGHIIDINRADLIYSDLKRRFHVDITHHWNGGLFPVLADNIEEASKHIAHDFITAIDWMAPYIIDMENMTTLVQWYQKSKGMLEYGKVYVELNQQLLGDLKSECDERFRTSEVFLNSVYMTAHDKISQNVSDSMVEGSNRMEMMTDFVILLAMISASVAIHSAIFSAIQINNPLLVMVILILFIDTPLIWMVHFRFWKGNLNYDISLSTIATLASVTYMLVFGIMIGAMILIMLDEACRNLTLNVSFCVFTLLCMVIIGLILRATCLSNDKIGKRLEKAGLEITTE